MKKIMFCFSVLVLLVSCNKKAADPELRNKYVSKIKELDQVYETARKKGIDFYEPGRVLADSCVSFVNKFPDDTVTPKMLYRLGILYITGLTDYKEGIKYFDLLYEKYPKHRLTPEGLYWSGNIYNFFMKKPEKAREYYEKIIKEYPDHRFAAESKILISNLGKSDEDFLKATEKAKEQVQK